MTSPTITLVSVDLHGDPAMYPTPGSEEFADLVGSGTPLLSDDGRYALFGSSAENLTLLNWNEIGQLYLRDLHTGVTTMVSVNQAGESLPNRGHSWEVDSTVGAFAITPNGNYALVESSFDLTKPDTPHTDFFAHEGELYEINLQTGSVKLVSADANGNPGAYGGNSLSLYDAFLHPFALSDDGRYALFETGFANLTGGPDRIVTFLKDLATGQLLPVSNNDFIAENATMSSDGRYVAFVSSPGLDPNFPAGEHQELELYLKDMQTGEIKLVSTDPAGNVHDISGDARAGSAGRYMSADGRYIAYDIENVAGDDRHLEVKDMRTGGVIEISASDVALNYNTVGSGALSADGHYLAFTANEVILDSHGVTSKIEKEILVENLLTGKVTVVASDPTGDGTYFDALISGDGRYVSFSSNVGTQPVPGFPQFNVDESFVADMRPQSTTITGGAEFLVNDAASTGSSDSAVVDLGNGKFAVAYVDNGAIKAAIFNDDGSAAVAPVTVGTDGGDHPSITLLSNGKFVVVWSDAGNSNIEGQIVDANGNNVGSEFHLASDFNIDGGSALSSVTALADGAFAVTYEKGISDSSITQIFNADGTPNGSAYNPESSLAGFQSHPHEATLTNGNFVTVWDDTRDSSGNEIRAAIYDAAGNAVVSDFLVYTDSTNHTLQQFSAVTALTGGDFVVTWTGRGGSADGSADGIFAQIYHSDGSTAGSVFTVNTTTARTQNFSSPAALDDGGFVIVWQSTDPTNSSPDVVTIRGQQYDAGGTAVGSEFLVNTGSGLVKNPAVAGLPGGAFVVTWNDASGTLGASNAAVHARVYSAENDTIAPAVTVGLANDTGASSSDLVTSDAHLTGTGDAGATVYFTIDGQLSAHTETADSSGAWTFLPPGLADGKHNIIVAETDSSNNTGYEEFNFTLDTTAPVLTIGTTINGAKTLTVSGTGDADGTVSVDFGDGATVVSVLADSTGHWHTAQHVYTANGTYTISASEVDVVGNSSASATHSVSFNDPASDKTPPTVTSVASPSSGSAIHAGQTVVIDLAMSEDVVVAGAPVLTLSDGGRATYDAVNSTSTDLKFTYTVLAGQNTADLKTTALTFPAGSSIKDTAGNAVVITGAAAKDLAIVVDTIAPLVKSALLADTGLTTDKITSVDTLTGSGDANATVTFKEGATTLGTVTAGATGAWTFTPSGLANGPHTIVASETDAAGNVGSSSLTFTFDTTAPSVQNVQNNGGTPYGLGEAVIVKLALGEAITVAGIPTLTFSNGGKGTYSAADSNLATGLLGFRYVPTAGQDTSDLVLTSVNLPTGASVKDIAGNAAFLTNANGTDLGFVIDTAAPTITGVSATPGAGGKVPLGGTVVIDLAMSEAVTVAGAAPVLTLSDGGKATYDAVNSTATHLKFNYTALAGQNTADLKTTALTFPTGSSIKDAAGNAVVITGAANKDLQIAVDTIAPVVKSAVRNDNGVSATDKITTDPMLTGTADANAIVTITEGATTLGSTMADSKGTWTYAPSGLADGLHAFVASETDAAGNVGSAPVLNVMLDTHNPTLSSITKSGAGADGAIHAGETLSVQLHFSEAMGNAAGMSLALSDGEVLKYNAAASNLAQGIVDFDGVITAGHNGNLSISSVTLTAPFLSDVAGNDFSAGTLIHRGLGVNVDTIAPTITNVSTPSSGVIMHAGQNIVINVSITEAVIVTGTPVLTLSDGGKATYDAVHSSSTVLSFNYTAAPGQNTADLKTAALTFPTGSSIKDTSGNSLVLADAVGKVLGVGVDTIAPTITKVAASLASGTLHAGSAPLSFTVTMSEAVNVGVAGGTPVLTLDDGGTAIYDAVNSTATALRFNYTVQTGQNTTALKVTGLDLAGGSISDLAGNAAVLTKAPTAFAAIHVDTAAPVVTSVVATPATGAQGTGAKIVLTLNMSEATTVSVGGAPTLTLSDGGTATFDAAHSTATALKFNYTVGAGDQNSFGLGITAYNAEGSSLTDAFTNTTSTPGGNVLATTAVQIHTSVADTWKNIALGDGKFETATNWSTGAVPGANNDALIMAAGTYTVTANSNETVASIATAKTATLDIASATTFTATYGTGPGTGANAGTVKVEDGATLKVGGTVNNTGTISLNAAASATTLMVSDVVTLTGLGHVTLGNNSNNLIASNGAAATLINVDNTIAGAGVIGEGNLAIVNQAKGVINATGSNALTLGNGNIVTNAGLIEATGTGGIFLASNLTTNTGTIESNAGLVDVTNTVNNTGGTFFATGANAQILFNFAHVTGGTFKTAGNSAAIQFENNNTITGVTNTGVMTTYAGGHLTLAGSSFNNTTTGIVHVLVNSDLVIGNNLSLQGGGKINLTATNASILSDGTHDATLTNTDNTIMGLGTIGDGHLSFVNAAKGVVDGYDTTNVLLFQSGVVTNAGLIKASGAGGVEFFTNEIDNTGTIEALSGMTAATVSLAGGRLVNTGSGSLVASGTNASININGLAVTGGTFKTVGTSAAINFQNTNNSISGVTNTGAMNLQLGAHVTLLGNAFNNTATGIVNLLTNSELIAGNDLSLLGAGKINLVVDTASVVSDGTHDAHLTNVNNIVSGAGTIGDTHLFIDNQAKGVIDATGATALTLHAAGFTNEGTLEAQGTSHLVIDHTTIAQSATGVIKTLAVGTATSAHIDLDGSTITGGVISTVKGSFIDTEGSTSSITGAKITNVGTIAADHGDLTITGAVVNTGVLAADNASHLILDGAVTGVGSATIDHNGLIDFTAASSAKVTFGAGGGTLELDHGSLATSKFTGTIAGFDHGDVVNLTDIASTASVVAVQNAAQTQTTVIVGDGANHSEQLIFVGNYAFNAFHIADDTHGHVNLLLV